MHKTKKWFSLIEIIIATWIITISVFWVYRLIWENTKLINGSWNYTQAYSLFPVFKECLINIWIDWITDKSIWSEYWIFLWDDFDSCELSNSWVVLDNIDYYLLWNITNASSDFIDWQLNINSDSVDNITLDFKQIKK